MTDTPMTPEYEREIRSHVAEMSNYSLGNLFARDLLAEVDRLRKALSEATDQVAELESDLGGASAENAQLRARVAGLTAAPVDEAVEMAEAEAELEAMRREHPAPCRVPDSPDCTCPDKLPVLTGADWDGPIARCSFGAHMAALLPSGRIARHRMGEGWLNACPGVGKPPRADEATP
ncbi:hypothetical protein ACIQH0_38070 [Streptomyces griseus]|uniref:hypothetical protein n=1 Tax=Streptomyces griseus TaxID=1911 RepID=UPI003822986C